jgi:hypothetical protein
MRITNQEEGISLVIRNDFDLVRNWVKSGNNFKAACQLSEDHLITYEDWHTSLVNFNKDTELIWKAVSRKFEHLTGWNIIE